MFELWFIKDKSMKLYLVITLFLTLSFFLLAIFYHYEEYLSYYGIIDDKFLVITIEKENLAHISNKLLINDEKTECTIDKISREYIVNTDYKLYHEVYYRCDSLENSSDNYVLDIKISKGNTTLLNKIKNMF